MSISQHTDDVALAQLGQLVICQNDGPKPFVDVYDGKRYEIAPGANRTVPIEAMWDWAGRPWVTDRDHNRERTAELERLRFKYGVFACPELEQSAQDNWDNNVPHLTFMGLDGEEHVTVLDDPEGERVSPADITVSDHTLLNARYEALQSQIQALESALAAQETRGHVPTADKVEEDTPNKIPVKPSDPPQNVGRTRGREPRPPRG